ncbi:hypothetical protein ACVNP1_01705 [Staphylococcus aureus]
MFEEGYRALLPNPLGQTVEPEMDLLTNSAMIVREGIPITMLIKIFMYWRHYLKRCLIHRCLSYHK